MRTATTLILAGAIASAALPAIADHPPYRTRHEADRLIAKCVREYGIEHSDRCVSIVEGDRSTANRARRDYWDRHDADRLRRCLDDPGMISPRLCDRRWP